MTAIDLKQPQGRRVPTLETLSASQVAAIRSIPAHEDAVAPQIEAGRPTSIFTDQGRYVSEQQRVFRRLPVPVTVSSMLAGPGAVFADTLYGAPLLMTRDREGRARVFLNACQHKGSKLVESCEPAKMSRLSCPYHAWTYALDGRLIGVPREETFRNLDKESRGLAELPCTEAGGVIWAHLDRRAEADFSSISDQVSEDFDRMEIPTAHMYGRKRFELKANWKLVLEPFLEGYHVQRLHAQSIGDQFADSPNAIDQFGLHTRQISGKANYRPDALEAPDENIHKIVTHAYLVFPSTVVITSPYYISVMIIMPDAADRSTVDYYMLTPSAAPNAKVEDVYARSYELILKVFGTEDFRAAEISQIGLESGALDEVVYGGLEESIPEYYKVLESFL